MSCGKSERRATDRYGLRGAMVGPSEGQSRAWRCYAGSGLAKILSDAQKLSSGGAGRIQTRRREDAKTQSSRRLKQICADSILPPADTSASPSFLCAIW